MFNNIKSISFRGGEVKQIVRTRDNVIIYQKEEENLFDNYIEIEFSGNTFSTYSSSPFTYTGDIFVDWGDNTGFIEYTGGQLSHTYASNDDYIIKIYGDITSLRSYCFANCNNLTSITLPDSITSLGDACFDGCTDLTSINIPDSVTSLGNFCFRSCTGLTSISIPNSVTSFGMECFQNCSGLTSINIPDNITNLGSYCFEDCVNLIEVVLNWSTSDTIKTYESSWIWHTNANLKFIIPPGTTSLYTNKSYPLSLIEEIVVHVINPESIEFISNKNSISYADNEDCLLTMVVLDENENSIENVSVELYKNNVLWDTLSTDSNGECSKTYSSVGVGDVVFEAICGAVSETITVEDCLYYKEESSTNPIVSSCTNNCIVEYEVYPSDQWNWHYLIIYDGEGNGQSIATLSTSYDNSSSAPIKTTNFPPRNVWTPIQLKIENNTATVSSNGSVKGTANITLSNVNNLRISNSKTTQQRNIKIKPL